MGVMMIRHGHWAVLIAILLGPPALAQDLVITPTEFSTWPEYCKARYVTVPPGSSSQWALSYPSTKIVAAKQLLGPATFERVHHYCNGLVWMARSRVQSDRQTKMFFLEEARDEVVFTYTGLPADSPMIAATFITLGQICMERDEQQCALENLKKGIAMRPSEASTYSALAVLYRKQHKLDLARDVLLQGDEAVGRRSAEIHYNLGLIYLELGDVDAAVERARSAYELRYPLPGLRTKLQRMGKWPSAE